MDDELVRTAYGRWAKSYDWTFGMLFGRARRRAVRVLGIERGFRVIEVGVGTGLSLPLMPADCRVVGVDFTRPMLERAVRRVRSHGLACEASLVEGDGARLPFADRTFDAALLPFVVSAAPDPVAVLRETSRVCRPGGKIVVLNHFTPRNPLLAGLERGASVITSRLAGFRADFPLEPLFHRAGITPDDIERAVGSWYIVSFTRREEGP